MKALIDTHRVIVCTGSGGVGKTTTAAALGVAAAQRGRRVLVLTIDPARRLASALGIALHGGDTRVPGQAYAGTLHAAMIEPAQIFREYIERHAANQAMAQRLFDNALYQQLATTLSGSQEFTSLSRLYDAASGGDYDLVILDTPPAAHAIDFLHAPEKLNAVFDSAIVSLFMGRASGLGFAASAWKQGMKMLLGTLTFLTGSAFVATFNDFFAAIDAIAPDIRETNLRAHELLLDARTAFVLVSSFDAAKIQEGKEFAAELAAAGYHLKALILNRAWPAWAVAAPAQQQAAAASLATAAPALGPLHTALLRYYDQRHALYAAQHEALILPEMPDDVHGLPALEALAALLLAGGVSATS